MKKRADVITFLVLLAIFIGLIIAIICTYSSNDFNVMFINRNLGVALFIIFGCIIGNFIYVKTLKSLPFSIIIAAILTGALICLNLLYIEILPLKYPFYKVGAVIYILAGAVFIQIKNAIVREKEKK